MKTIFMLLMILLLNSCGVDTSSSTKTTAPVDVIDQNSIDGGEVTNSTEDTTNSTEDTTDSTNVTDSTDTINPSDANCSEDLVYECGDASYDTDSCSALTYKTVSDASYYGTDPAENGSDFRSAEGEGLSIRSEYLEGNSADLYKTWVTLYYKSFPDTTSLGLQGYTSYIKSGYFFLTYDIAWSDTSIEGVDRTMYVRTNKDDKPSCYRLILNTIDGTQISIQKVYR